jgi:hypothetical protein
VTFTRGNKHGRKMKALIWKKAKKKPTLSSLKKNAWKLVSEYVRRKYADEGGTTECYTCGKLLHWKYDAQAGHAIPGRHNAVLFDLEILRPQCYACNCMSGGKYHIFATKLIRENGMEWWEAKLQGSRAVVKRTRSDLEEMISTYKQKLEALA